MPRLSVAFRHPTTTALVDEASNVMPSRAVLDAYGLLWILGEEAEELVPAAPAVTVSQLRSLYLAAKEASPKPPSPRTLKDYRQYVRDHVDSLWFGALPADDVDQEQARQWQAEIAAKDGYSNESAMKVRTSVVAPAFKWARISTKKHQVPIRTWSSPFEGLPMLETVVERQDRLESIDEIHAFINCAYEVDPNWGDLVVTKLCSGSRYGEITVPLVESVKPRAIELLRRQTNGTIRKGTKAGTNIWRFAPLPPLVLDILKLRAGSRRIRTAPTVRPDVLPSPDQCAGYARDPGVLTRRHIVVALADCQTHGRRRLPRSDRSASSSNTVAIRSIPERTGAVGTAEGAWENDLGGSWAHKLWMENHWMDATVGDPSDLDYLAGPVEGRGATPTMTRPQLLPLGSLLPRDFERLCYRLVGLMGTVEDHRMYGVPGQDQYGIDLYARMRDGSYMTVQCKRSTDGFDPGEITEAVIRFLADVWAPVYPGFRS